MPRNVNNINQVSYSQEAPGSVADKDETDDDELRRRVEEFIEKVYKGRKENY